jgi:membrane protease YdiL (CAAX protease family)
MEWVLLVLSATVVAPIWEELLYRGILQPWFASRRHGGAIALACAFLFALLACYERIGSSMSQGPAALLEASLPALAVLLLVLVYLVIERLSKSPVPPGLFGTAALFAWMHARAWPTPVALLFLGLVLGYLAYRTRSLVAPIALHAAFNGTACVLLLLQSRGGSWS